MRLPLRMALSHQAGPRRDDELFEFGPRDDALIGRAPRFVVAFRDRAGIVGLGATDFDQDGAHGAIKASDSTGFKGRDSRSVNDVDY